MSLFYNFLKKNKVRETTLPDVKAYHVAVLSRTCGTGRGTDRHKINGTENPETEPKYAQFIFDK